MVRALSVLRLPELAPDTGDLATEELAGKPSAAPASLLDRTLPLWGLATFFAMLALTVVLVAQPTHYVVDNLFAWFWRPTAVLRSWRSPWDPQGGLGAARPDFSPVFVGVMALVR